MNFSNLISFFVIFGLFSQGCSFNHYGRNYTHPDKPRFISLGLEHTPDPDQKTIKVVSYNIKEADDVKEAIQILVNEDLDSADIMCLQEMDSEGVEEIATSLGYNYVYYPASIHDDKDFGNAILSKWPILSDQKIILPHLNMDFSQRIAIRATVKIMEEKVQVFSVHLGVVIRPNQRGDQIDKIIQSINPNINNIIVAGDFNSFTKNNTIATFEPFKEEYFRYASRKVGWSYRQPLFLFKKFTLDHIFTRGLKEVASGKVVHFGPSDHIPIWVELEFQ